MAKKDTFKNQQKFIEIFRKKHGNVSLACAGVGIARKTYYEWRKKFPEFKEQITDVEEGLLDMTESILFKKIEQGETRCAIWFLETKGKDRGYSNRKLCSQCRSNLNNKNSKTSRTILYLPDNGRDKLR